MIKLIDSYSYSNQLRNESAVWKTGFAVIMLIMTYFSNAVFQAVIFCWMMYWTVVHARIPFKIYSKLIIVPFLFYAASLPAIILEISHAVSNDTLMLPDHYVIATFHNWSIYMTSTGIHRGLSLGVQIAACSSCVTFIVMTTPMSELFQLMNKLKIHPLLIELMLIMYRFLFILMETSTMIYTAQTARGGQTGFRSRLRDSSILISRLIVKTIQRYDELNQGLTARGFAGELRLAPYSHKAVLRRYRIESFIGISMLLLLNLIYR
ncbi:hypothetical protein ASG89_23150 [Paenibacillus sp. Soil766]|uniref:cobalt ECF transporter T component CbiQ n=1 Tax=Paenibacillus sp. Soil766 TaxID=1736404 RepID=UPI00070AA8B5|nr:cobalt ECF transporter T component CbiQ [Paenibacillus sp. Soil766]KRF03343.1 hypothetical protein ASG89_23150 [Paenibacillus sp. Soil766]